MNEEIKLVAPYNQAAIDVDEQKIVRAYATPFDDESTLPFIYHINHRQDDVEIERGYYQYVGLEPRSFRKLLDDAAPELEKRASMSFIDVGSGIGDKVYLAHKLGFGEVTGIEYNTYTHAIAKATMARIGLTSATLLRGDAIEHDYSPYDVIYMYRPIEGVRYLTLLLERVLDTMKPGATTVDVLMHNSLVAATSYCSPRFAHVFNAAVVTDSPDIHGVHKTERGTFEFVFRNGLKPVIWVPPLRR